MQYNKHMNEYLELIILEINRQLPFQFLGAMACNFEVIIMTSRTERKKETKKEYYFALIKLQYNCIQINIQNR